MGDSTATLILLDSGHIFSLPDNASKLSIGKSPDNDLHISNDPAVSRVHAALERIGPAWCIWDLGAKNGTLVNGTRISSKKTLDDRDELLLGRTRLLFRDPDARNEETTQPVRHAPDRTNKEQEVLEELCRPVLCGNGPLRLPASRREIAAKMFCGEGNVQQHLENLYRKFRIYDVEGQPRRVLLANEAIQSGAVTRKDLDCPDPG